jgi:hypothetical protein
VTPAIAGVTPRTPSLDATHSHALRPRRQPPSKPDALSSTAPIRVPVSQRWFHEPVAVPSLPIDPVSLSLPLSQSVGPVGISSPPASETSAAVLEPPLLLAATTRGTLVDQIMEIRPCPAEVSGSVPDPDEICRGLDATTLPTLTPRQSWMLEDDPRSEIEADEDWHRANQHWNFRHDKYEAAIAAEMGPLPVTTSLLHTFAQAVASSTASHVPLDLSHAYLPPVAPQEPVPSFMVEMSRWPSFPRQQVSHLNTKVLRRILAARESIFKYGIYLPRNDRDADASPESLRWNSGRQLEWLRLKKVEAFEYDWTKERLAREYPDYLFSDIGHLFYIYDYKISGEHRVRLVFDGSREGINTYDETYSPTVRPESIRLFHVYAVEMGWDIKQYDVSQAFLQSPVDYDIFVYPPRANVEFPGQLLKLRLALYGAKQSSALFFKLLNGFLLSLGFVSSTLDACFYKRDDALLIVHVDDMRCAGTPEVLQSIHEALFARFKITTGDGNRFLGMDTRYDLHAGVLSMGMETYILSTMDRFATFDLTLGIPYREIVGCLLWIVLCVVGPELVRVKDLARRSNAPTLSDYNDAVKVLKRIHKHRSSVILFKRGFAGREMVPSQTRPDPITISPSSLLALGALSPDHLSSSTHSQSDVYASFDAMQPRLEISTPVLPITSRFTITAYTDASFAVGEEKESVSGFVLYVNGTPVMWGSMRQTSGADSTCAAEFVAASVCCKQLLHVENVSFLWDRLSEAVHCVHGLSSQPDHCHEFDENGPHPPRCHLLSLGSMHGDKW